MQGCISACCADASGDSASLQGVLRESAKSELPRRSAQEQLECQKQGYARLAAGLLADPSCNLIAQVANLMNNNTRTYVANLMHRNKRPHVTNLMSNITRPNIALRKRLTNTSQFMQIV